MNSLKYILAFLLLFVSLEILADEWVLCANENQICNFVGQKKIRYGAGDRWHYITARGGIPCNNKVFGDPIYGTVKRCYFYQESDYQWTQCAEENGYCAFRGREQVRYGVNGQYYYKILEDGVYCDNRVFGDPQYGVKKYCYIQQRRF
jgi:hypothetical protein